MSNRVVVVGGGIIGSSVALAPAPSHDVTVVKRDELASGATGLSAGVIAPMLFRPKRSRRLASTEKSRLNSVRQLTCDLVC